MRDNNLKQFLLPDRKLGVGLIMLLLTCSAFADDKEFDGYSYAVIGVESLNYQEKPGSVPVHTSTTVNNIALRTGGLFTINNTLDFSVDTGATLLPYTSTETWKVNGDGGSAALLSTLPQPNQPIQTNDFRLAISNLQVLLQYKHTDSIRSVFGADYSLDSFKRYNWATVQGSAVTLSQGAVEEDTSTMDATFGFAYESGAVAKQNQRWQFRTLLHLPVWRQTTNTNNPSLTFNNRSGFLVDLQGSYNYRFYRGMEIGGYGSYGIRKESATVVGSVELPKNTMNSYFIGVQLSWNLSRKDVY